MKVLAEGKWKVPWEGERDCGTAQCGAKLLVEERDLFAIDYSDAFGFTCVVCGKVTRVPRSEIPERIKEKLEKTRVVNTDYDR